MLLNNKLNILLGWQYCIDSSEGGWSPVPRSYHLCRRRRWVRKRAVEQDPQILIKKKKEAAKLGEGWEYAPMFGMKYHLKENRLDFARRRKWRRKMVNTKPGALPMFTINDKDDKMQRIMPRIFLSYDSRCNCYEFRSFTFISSTSKFNKEKVELLLGLIIQKEYPCKGHFPYHIRTIQLICAADWFLYNKKTVTTFGFRNCGIT